NCRVPIHGILRADDGTRVDVESRADLEALQIDLRTCAVQGDRFGHARAQTGERRLDGFHAVVGVFDADGVADLLPGAQLHREVAGGLHDHLTAERPRTDLRQVAQSVPFPDRLRLDPQRVALRRGRVLAGEALELVEIDVPD